VGYAEQKLGYAEQKLRNKLMTPIGQLKFEVSRAYNGERMHLHTCMSS
jgi:hypothetical protein